MKRLVFALVLTGMTGCYSDKLLDGAIEIPLTDEGCRGTEMSEGWGVAEPPRFMGDDASRTTWGIRGSCPFTPPADWEAVAQPGVSVGWVIDAFRVPFEEAESGEWVEVELGASGLIEPPFFEVRFHPEPPADSPCLDPGTARARRIGDDPWETLELEVTHPCVTADYVFTNNY